MNRRAFIHGATAAASGLLLRAYPRKPIENAWAPHARDIEAQIPELMRTAKVPGLSLAVFARGKIV